MRCSRCDRGDGTHEPGCGEQPKTTAEAFDDVREAWRELLLEVAKALHIFTLLDWLKALLEDRRDRREERKIEKEGKLEDSLR